MQKIVVGKNRDKEGRFRALKLIEIEILRGDYALNSAEEQFFMSRDWRLTPERVVAIYVRQDHEGQVYYYPFDRFSTDRIGSMEVSLPQVVLGQGAIYIFDEKAVMVGEVLVVSVMD